MTPAVPDPTVEALSEGDLAALDATDEAHDYPTETDDGLVMRCRCGATPPSHLLGVQVDEAMWLWTHRRAERHAVVATILAEHTERAVREALEAAADELLPMTHASAHREVCANQYRSDRTAAHVALDVAADWLRTRARIASTGGRP